MSAVRSLARAGALAASLLAAAAGSAPAHADEQSFERIQRGRVLATVGDCVACHTAIGGKPFAGGLPIETPFGSVVAPNLTPDVATGIGGWTDAQFLRAMQHGIGRNGEHLYPAFPYQYFARAKPADLLDIRAYLSTLDPVVNAVDRNRMDFPFDIRLSMFGWNLLFFDSKPVVAVSGKSAEWNRGAYLVETLGHCAACHTAKNFLGGDKTSHSLQGGNIQNWFAPALDADPRTGLGAWSVRQVVDYLKTGQNDIAAASGPMADVITHSTSQLPMADLQAMAVYLKDQPAPHEEAPTPLAANDPVMRAGAAIYADNCAACHTAAGTGMPRLFPALKGSAVVQSASTASLLRVVLIGAQAVATDALPTGAAMPAFAWKLSDAQVAAVTTYVRNAWGNAASPVSADAAQDMRANLAK